jgi:hypothetical protein
MTTCEPGAKNVLSLSLADFFPGLLVAVVVFISRIFSKKEASPGSAETLSPRDTTRRRVSETGFKSLVVIRSGVRGLGIESAGRCFSIDGMTGTQRRDGVNLISGGLNTGRSS